MKWGHPLTQTPNGVTLLVLFLLAVAVYLLITGLLAGCAPAPSDFCAAVHAGGLIQTSDQPVAFDVVFNREIVARGVSAERIVKECQ